MIGLTFSQNVTDSAIISIMALSVTRQASWAITSITVPSVKFLRESNRAGNSNFRMCFVQCKTVKNHPIYIIIIM